jgi:carbon-monoxide dehydrogenase iron sulfur subunit
VLQLDAARCESCGQCALACPHGALRLHPKTDHPLVCDLCGGDPACVAACVTGALSLKERQ